ncbi:hypothetical protein [Haloprofundus salilacus]|uniref:hypothetical protein n=1 Tax=Haloprofundus salilacus TaxID=2876190 RepID=UPI001CC943B2|nr:hypothetical protein [Haloprofundus salilacus]
MPFILSVAVMFPLNNRPSNTPTRRHFCKMSLAALTSGISATTSGCLSGLPPLGQKQSYGRIEVPASTDPKYKRWLPRPSPDTDNPSWQTFVYATPTTIKGTEPEEFLFRRGALKRDLDYFGIGFEKYDWILDCDYGTVIEASFQPSSVVQTLTESGYEPAGSYREYELFSRTDVNRNVAVRDGVIVWSSAQVHENPTIERLIHTAAGEYPRRYDVDEEFARICNAIGGNRMLILGPNFADPTEMAKLGADGFRFEDDTAYQVIKLLFSAQRTPTTKQLQHAFRDEYGLTEEADVFDVQVDGRLGTLETRVSQTSARELTPLVDPPQITWGASFDANSGQLTIRHEAGDVLDSEWLWYDISTPDDAGEIEKRPLWPSKKQVSRGDSTSIDLSEYPTADAVTLLIATSECCDFNHLFEYRLE